MTNAADLIEKANDAMSDGDENTALEYYEKALDADPENAQAWFCKGTIMANRGEYKQAVDCYARSAANAGERAPLPLYNMGNALQKMDRYEDAIAAFEKALKLDPTLCDAWINRGRLLDDLGHHKEAIESYDRSLEMDPNDPMAWTNRGNSLRSLEQFEEGLASYANALQLNPADFKAFLGAAVCYSHLGDTEKGLQMFSELEEFCEPWIMVEHSIVLALAGKNEDALTKLDEAISVNPEIPEAWNNRAEILAKLDRTDEAIECFDKALHIADNFECAWFGKARLLYNNGRKEESRDAIEHYFQFTDGTDAAHALKALLEADGLKVTITKAKMM